MSKAHAELCRGLRYTFVNSDLLELALTHRSRGGANNERLEFLGDSVLNLTISFELYDRFPELTEGELTRVRASLVKEETLASLARGLRLGEHLLLGSGELKSGGYDRDSILADALEAVFGAVYKDSGLGEARTIILHLYHDRLARLDPRSIPKDPKTELQEHLQKYSLPLPVYRVAGVSGEPHNQVFIVECAVEGLPVPARGEGSTRRAAEQQAASRALAQLASSREAPAKR